VYKIIHLQTIQRKIVSFFITFCISTAVLKLNCRLLTLYFFGPPGERIIITMVLSYILEEKLLWTSYGAVMYIQLGEKALRFLNSSSASFTMYFPPRSTNGALKHVPVPGGENGWIDKKKTRVIGNNTSLKKKKRKKGSAIDVSSNTCDDNVISIDIDEESIGKCHRQKRSINKNRIVYCEDSDTSEL
jgi:hypothetical protein